MRLARRILLALALCPTMAAAQWAGQIDAGTRVRVTAPSIVPQPVVGAFLSSERDSIRVRAEDGKFRVAIPMARVQQLEVADGRSRGRWARWGAVAGAIGGTVIGGLGGSGTTRPADDWGRVGGLVLGVPLGALAGALLAPERWREHSVVGLR